MLSKCNVMGVMDVVNKDITLLTSKPDRSRLGIAL